jgi:deoxyhypusine synthase
MVPAGMGGIISDLMNAGYIDVLVSTGANLTMILLRRLGVIIIGNREM